MMRTLLRFSLLGLLLVGLALGLRLRVAEAAHASRHMTSKPAWQHCQPHIHVVPSPNPPGSFFNSLNGIETISANDIWAVGTSDSTTLIEHWNGSRWSVVPSPNPGLFDNELSKIEAISANNIWAVGSLTNTSDSVPKRTLIEHWNGSRWSVVPSPNRGFSDELIGIEAISANDIWAVGDFANGHGNFQTLIEHWNGSNWSVVPSPSPNRGSSFLNEVEAVSAISGLSAVPLAPSARSGR